MIHHSQKIYKEVNELKIDFKKELAFTSDYLQREVLLEEFKNNTLNKFLAKTKILKRKSTTEACNNTYKKVILNENIRDEDCCSCFQNESYLIELMAWSEIYRTEFEERKKNIEEGKILREEFGTDQIAGLKTALFIGNYDRFFEIIRSIFSSISYQINKAKEGYFHSNLHTLLRTIGFKITSENSTNIGRIDSVLETKSTVYIMEFKMDTASKAIQQIKEKKYYEPHLAGDKRIVLIGVSFSDKERNINDYQIELFKK